MKFTLDTSTKVLLGIFAVLAALYKAFRFIARIEAKQELIDEKLKALWTLNYRQGADAALSTEHIGLKKDAEKTPNISLNDIITKNGIKNYFGTMCYDLRRLYLE